MSTWCSSLGRAPPPTRRAERKNPTRPGTPTAQAPNTAGRPRQAISPATNGRATKVTISVIACSPMLQRCVHRGTYCHRHLACRQHRRSPQDPGLRTDGPPRLRPDFGDAAGIRLLRVSSVSSSRPRSPDEAQRNPGFPRRIDTAPDCAELHRATKILAPLSLRCAFAFSRRTAGGPDNFCRRSSAIRIENLAAVRLRRTICEKLPGWRKAGACE